MKLMLLGLLAVAYAMPDGFDKPCDPLVTHCPRQLPGTPRQNSCGKYGTILGVCMAKFIVLIFILVNNI